MQAAAFDQMTSDIATKAFPKNEITVKENVAYILANEEKNAPEIIMDYAGLMHLHKTYENGVELRVTPEKRYPIFFPIQENGETGEEFKFLLQFLLTKKEPKAKATTDVFSKDSNIYNAIMKNITSHRPQMKVFDSPFKFNLKLLVDAWSNGKNDVIEEFIQSKFHNKLTVDWEAKTVTIQQNKNDSSYIEGDELKNAVTSLEEFVALAEMIKSKEKHHSKVKHRKWLINFTKNGIVVKAKFYNSTDNHNIIPLERIILGEATTLQKSTPVYFKDGDSLNVTLGNLGRKAVKGSTKASDFVAPKGFSEKTKTGKEKSDKKPTAAKKSVTISPQATAKDLVKIVTKANIEQHQKDEIIDILVG